MNDMVQKLVFPLLVGIIWQMFTIKADVGAILIQMEVIAPLASETNSEQRERKDIIVWAREHRATLEAHSHSEKQL